MNKYLHHLVTLALFSCTQLSAQGPVFDWVRQTGGTGGDAGFSITTDGSGNVYVCGVFEGTVDFDPGAGVFNLTSAGDRDAYIQKSDANGNFLWAVQAGGAGYDEARTVTSSTDGSVYISGAFSGTADLDPGASVFNLISNGFSDAFILKLDSAGNFLWARQAGGSLTDYAYSVSLDVDGNIFSTGMFGDTVDFDPGAGTAMLVSNGFNDVFVWKLDTAGNFVWVRQVGGTGNEYAKSIAADDDGNSYTAVFFESVVDFDPGAAVFSLTSAGGKDIAILKLNAAGDLSWAKQMGGAEDDVIHSIIDGKNFIYTTGASKGTVDFDPGTAVFNLTSAGGADIFIEKMDTAGNFIYAKQTGGTSDDAGYSITEGEDGNIYTTGTFSGTVDFDPGAGSSSFVSNGFADIFIQELDASGNFVWAGQMGSVSIDQGLSVAAGISGSVLTTGTFDNTVDFDPGAGVSDLTSLGSDDIFIQKLSPAPMGMWNDAFSENWKLYPNPTSGQLTLDFDGSGSGLCIEIADMTGRVRMRNEIVSPGSFSFCLDGPAGLYLISVTGASGERSLKKVIKQ